MPPKLLTFAFKSTKKMKKLFSLAAATAALLLAGACTHEEGMTTETLEKEGAVPLIEGMELNEDAPCYSYSYNVQYITGGIKKEVMDKINAKIAGFIIYDDEENPNPDVAGALQAWENSGVEGYKAETEDLPEDFDLDESWMYNWSSYISGNFSSVCEARDWMTYVFGGSDYMGGAHPFSYANYTVFDMKTGDVITEKDFLDVENDDLWEILYAKVLDGGCIDDEGLTSEDLFELPTFNGNFSVDNEGVTWLYNPYEIAAYVYGPIEATITWDELAPYLLKK